LVRQKSWNGEGWNFKLQGADAGKVGLEEAAIAIVSDITVRGLLEETGESLSEIDRNTPRRE